MTAADLGYRTVVRPPGDGRWREDGDCAQVDPDVMFPERSAAGDAQARRICQPCLARRACLDDALIEETGKAESGRHGVRGGLTPRERCELDPTVVGEAPGLIGAVGR